MLTGLSTVCVRRYDWVHIPIRKLRTQTVLCAVADMFAFYSNLRRRRVLRRHRSPPSPTRRRTTIHPVRAPAYPFLSLTFKNPTHHPILSLTVT